LNSHSHFWHICVPIPMGYSHGNPMGMKIPFPCTSLLRIQDVILLRTETRIFDQNPRSDADSQFSDPHMSELRRASCGARLMTLRCSNTLAAVLIKTVRHHYLHRKKLRLKQQQAKTLRFFRVIYLRFPNGRICSQCLQ